MTRYHSYRKLATGLALALLLLVVSVKLSPAAQATGSLASTFHFLPPLGKGEDDSGQNDTSLLNSLKVTLCRKEAAGSCGNVREYTSLTSGWDSDAITLRENFYQVRLHFSKNQIGKQFEIGISVADLDLAKIIYTPAKIGYLPVRFCVEKHSQIRARVLHAQENSAASIAIALKAEFNVQVQEMVQILRGEYLPAIEILKAARQVYQLDAVSLARIMSLDFALEPAAAAQYLIDLDYSDQEITTALRDGYALDVVLTGQAMKDAGFSASRVYQGIRSVFGVEVSESWDKLEKMGFSKDEIIQATIQDLAVKFAPALKLDSGSHMTANADSYPMSAQAYFDLIHLYPGTVINNADRNSIENNQVPIYYKYFVCGNQIRLVYWVYFGHQYKCDASGLSGIHRADWENLLVVLSENKKGVTAVTYGQHGGFYTRIAVRNGFPIMQGTHPVVYVGRNSHGFYHDTQTLAQTCCYWGDHRDGNGPVMMTWKSPLIRMQPALEEGKTWTEAELKIYAMLGIPPFGADDGEPWMNEDLKGEFIWGEISNHPMKNTRGLCGQYTCAGITTPACNESGCWKSQCEVGDRDDGTTCWHNTWGTYGLRYHISTSDAGLLYKAP